MTRKNSYERERELRLCGYSAERAYALAKTINIDTRMDHLIVQERSELFWTNMFDEKYVERFEETFKKFPGILTVMKNAALDYLKGSDAKKFIEKCARLHISNYHEEIKEEAYYTTLAYSAVEALRRRSVA